MLSHALRFLSTLGCRVTCAERQQRERGDAVLVGQREPAARRWAASAQAGRRAGGRVGRTAARSAAATWHARPSARPPARARVSASKRRGAHPAPSARASGSGSRTWSVRRRWPTKCLSCHREGRVGPCRGGWVACGACLLERRGARGARVGRPAHAQPDPPVSRLRIAARTKAPVRHVRLVKQRRRRRRREGATPRLGPVQPGLLGRRRGRRGGGMVT